MHWETTSNTDCMNHIFTVQSMVDGRHLEIVRKVVITVFRPERATILSLRMVARHVQGSQPTRVKKKLVWYWTLWQCEKHLHSFGCLCPFFWWKVYVGATFVIRLCQCRLPSSICALALIGPFSARYIFIQIFWFLWSVPPFEVSTAAPIYVPVRRLGSNDFNGQCDKIMGFFLSQYQFANIP